MNQVFSFGDFAQHCRRSYRSTVLQPQEQLSLLQRDCLALLDSYHPDRSQKLACRAGCGHCCIVNVTVLLPEALAIVDYLAGEYEQEMSFLEQLDLLWTSIRGLDDEERVCMRKPCAFLDKAGSCSVYPVRPLLCRGATSTAAESCRESFNAYLYNEQLGVQMNLFQRDLYSAAFLGLSEGLEDQGVDSRGFELTGIVRYLLRNPQQRPALQAGLRLNWSELA